MIKTIKLDGVNNYFYDKLTGETIEKYDDSRDLGLVLTLDDSTLKVENKMITKQYDGQIIVQHNNDRYIIDDGYYNTLIKSGYIVFSSYDIVNISPEDKEFGITLRDNVISNIRTICMKLNREYNLKNGNIPPFPTLETSGNKTIFYILTEDYNYTFIFDTINNMVNKNQGRKDNNLVFYPFKKNMDRYGTVYLSIFCQKNRKIENNNSRKKYVLPDTIIKKITEELNKIGEYHYSANQIKRRLVYCKGL